MVFSLPILRQRSQDAIHDLPALKHAAQKVASHVIHGIHGQKKSGGHERFWQFREYHETDRPQDIDWRQSAKTDHIYVREKEFQTPQSIYFWANRSNSMRFQSKSAFCSKLETAQILSLAMAMLFVRSDERVGVLGQSKVGHSDNALDTIGRDLLDNHEDFHPRGHIPAHSTVVLCSDFLSPKEEIESALAPLAGKNSHGIIVQILDPAEHELSYDGNVVFHDDMSQRHKVDDVTSIREAYQHKIQNHISDIKTLCSSFGWSHYLHITDQPLEDVLQSIWDGEQR